jgi:DNA-binding CsgD family transcriptional regulator
MRSAGGLDLPEMPGLMRARQLEVLTRSLLAAGRTEEAAQAALFSEARAMQAAVPLSRAAGERAAARLALASGDAAGAARRALLSAEIADGVGAPIEGGVSHMVAGEAYAALGDSERAIAELQRAAEAFDRCGALRYRDAAEKELRRLGHAVHRRTRRGNLDESGLGSLTGRELEIAQLVVDRRTNPQIAEELFLSIKTVETHLRNIFRKLGASSRVEVARIVERGAQDQGVHPM